MNEQFEYEPLERVFRSLEAASSEDEHAQLMKNLEARGLNPVKTTAVVKEKVAAFLKANRLSWREAAKQKQEKLNTLAARAMSWTKRKQEEIEKAFANVQSGTYGPAALMKLQSAHRNLAKISLQDKATFLDDIDILCELKEGEDRTRVEM